MAENVGIREAAAISLIKRAVDLDKKNRKTEALLYYKEGLQIFMEVLKCKETIFLTLPFLFTIQKAIHIRRVNPVVINHITCPYLIQLNLFVLSGKITSRTYAGQKVCPEF